MTEIEKKRLETIDRELIYYTVLEHKYLRENNIIGAERLRSNIFNLNVERRYIVSGRSAEITKELLEQINNLKSEDKPVISIGSRVIDCPSLELCYDLKEKSSKDRTKVKIKEKTLDK